MYKAGGIIGLIAGIFGFFAAIFTLFAGGLGAAFGAKGADSVVGLGWGGIFFSFLTIIFAAVVFSKPKGAGIGLIICAVLGAILGGTAVAICMVLAAIGGLLAVLDSSSSKMTTHILSVDKNPVSVLSGEIISQADPLASTDSFNQTALKKTNTKPWLVPVLVSVLVILVVLAILGAQSKSNIKTSTSQDSKTNIPSEVTNNIKKISSLDDLSAAIPDNTDSKIVTKCALKLNAGSVAEKNECIEQLENGRIVEWYMAAHEVRQSGDDYLVMTNAGLGSFIMVQITPRSQEDKEFMEHLTMGDGFAFKGVLGNEGDVVLIKPAILVPKPVKQTNQAATNSQETTQNNQSEPSTTIDSEVPKEKGHKAFVYKPPSNVRTEPNGDVLCSIDEPTDITVYDYAGSTYNGSREVKWYYTDACGSMGVIAYSQFR